MGSNVTPRIARFGKTAFPLVALNHDGVVFVTHANEAVFAAAAVQLAPVNTPVATPRLPSLVPTTTEPGSLCATSRAVIDPLPFVTSTRPATLENRWAAPNTTLLQFDVAQWNVSTRNGALHDGRSLPAIQGCDTAAYAPEAPVVDRTR